MKNERKSFIPRKKIYGDQLVNFAREHYITNTKRQILKRAEANYERFFCVASKENEVKKKVVVKVMKFLKESIAKKIKLTTD